MENINFEVKNIKDADKNGYVVLDVVYEGSSKVYTYVRKQYWDNKNNDRATIIEGVAIHFLENDEGIYEVKNYIREYETKGVKKTSSVTNGKKKAKTITESIKNEIEVNNIKNTDSVKHEKFEMIKTCIDNNIPVYLAGPAGSGKNHTLEQIAKEMGLDFYFTNSVQQEYKLTGFIDAGGIFHETEFYKAFKNGGLFFLDEMDASIPEVLVLLNAAIANGYFEFPNGRINAHKNFRVVAAGNTVGNGADDNYTGRMVLDQATLDRFAIIDFDYDVKIELFLAKGNSELVEFIESLRESATNNAIRATFSYRCISMVAKLEGKMNLIDIIKISVVKGLDNDTINTLIGGCNCYNKYSEALKALTA